MTGFNPMPGLAMLSGIDIVVLILMFAGVTAAGHWLGGRHVTNSRGFFLGDRSMPWWAVSASMIATKVSGLTFIALPAAVFVTGGNMMYVQLTIGFALGNILMAWIFVKPYMEDEIYSPYEYMGRRIDPRVAALARVLFLVGTVLSQSVRLLATSVVLEVITGLPMTLCIILIVIFSVVWSCMGGIQTVIWTDLILFLTFMAGGILGVVEAFAGASLPLPEILQVLDDKAKLALLDLSLDPRKAYTLWAGLIGAAIFEMGSNAIDQVVTQRVMSCRNIREARWACIGSAMGILPSYLMLLAGLGLTVFYSVHPLPAEMAHLTERGQDGIFPYFIVTELPSGLAGLLIATLFAAGISTLDSALTALAQTSVGGLLRGVMPGQDPSNQDSDAQRKALRRSRGFVVMWGGVLGGMGLVFMVIQQKTNTGLLDLGLKVPGYVYGSLLGMALLARFRRGTWASVFVGTILSVGTVLGLQAAGIAFFWWYPVAAIVMIAAAAWFRLDSTCGAMRHGP